MIAVLWMTTEENSMMDPGLKQAGEKHYIRIINGKEALDRFKVKPEHYTKGHPDKEAHAAYAKVISEAIAGHMIIQGISPIGLNQ